MNLLIIIFFVIKRAKLVVGVEIVPEAIEDAKLNSTLNGNIEDTFYTYIFQNLVVKSASLWKKNLKKILR